MGNRISEEISAAIKLFERKAYNRESEKLEIKTAVIAFLLLISIIIVPAAAFHAFEKWTYFESVYFCFVTLSTIGFGDFVPVTLKNDSSDGEDRAVPVILEFLNLIYMVVGLAVMSGVIVSISGVIEEKTKNMVMPDPLETLKAIQVGNLNSKAMKKLGYKMGPTPSNDDVRQRIPPRMNSSIARGLDAPSNLDRRQSADNMDFQGPTPILHLNKNSTPCDGVNTPDGSPRDPNKPKLMFNNKVAPTGAESDLRENDERRISAISSFENRSDSHDEIERELAPSNSDTRRNTLTEKTGSKNELVSIYIYPVAI